MIWALVAMMDMRYSKVINSIAKIVFYAKIRLL